MFTICNASANEFNQWDLNQCVIEPRLAVGDKVIFLNSSGMTFPMKAYSHNGDVVVDVPNKLLTMSMPIVVYINGYCETRTSFNVVAQTKPDGYVYVDNDDWPSDVELPTTVPNIQTAEVGQAIVVKAVDKNGKPTEWEAASVGGSGGGLPVVKLTTVAKDRDTELSDDEQILMDEADALELPIVFQVPVTFIGKSSTWVQNVSVMLNRTLNDDGVTGYYHTNNHPLSEGNVLTLTVVRPISGMAPWAVKGTITSA